MANVFRIISATDSDEKRARNQAAAIAEMPNAAESVSVTVVHVYPEVRSDEGASLDMRQNNPVYMLSAHWLQIS